MTISRINYYLSWIQLIGFTLIFLIFSIYCFYEGKMAPLLIPFALILFLPFSLIAFYELNILSQNESKLKLIINITLFLIALPTLFLPVFYEFGGIVIALICLGIVFIIYFKKQVQIQLLVINTIGLLIIISLIAISIYGELKPTNY